MIEGREDILIHEIAAGWDDDAGRVLFVGPESVLRRYTATVLQMEGFQLWVADDANVGTHLLHRHLPEVALLDTDGLTDWAATLAALRGVDAAIPFVLLVGGAGSPPRGQVVPTGVPAPSLLRRPVAHRTLLFTIGSLCRETQVRRSVVGSALGSARWLSLFSKS